MDTRVAVISIIVENPAAIEELNHYLHEAGEYIIGRMGIPYREKGINIISIAIDAPDVYKRQTMLYYDPEKSGVNMTIGKDAGYYHPDQPNVIWNQDRQPYGYAGVTRLFETLLEV